MSKDFADPFALPPALCTRRGSQSDRVDQRLERAGMESATARGPPSDTVCRPPISEHTRINLQRLPPPCHNHVKCRTDTLRQFSMVFPRTQRNGWLICAVTQMSEVDQLAAFSLFLKESAIDWYNALEEDVRGDLEQLLDEFKSFFCPSALDHALRAESVFIRVQRPSERVRDYVAAVQKLARHIPRLDEQILKYIVLRGLLPRTKAFVL